MDRPLAIIIVSIDMPHDIQTRPFDKALFGGQGASRSPVFDMPMLNHHFVYDRNCWIAQLTLNGCIVHIGSDLQQRARKSTWVRKEGKKAFLEKHLA